MARVKTLALDKRMDSTAFSLLGLAMIFAAIGTTAFQATGIVPAVAALGLSIPLLTTVSLRN